MEIARPWHKKKRYRLFLLGLVALFIFSRSETAKMRYDKSRMLQSLKKSTSLLVRFAKGNLGEKSIQYLQVGERSDLPLVIFVHGSPGALNAYESYLKDDELLSQADLIAVDRPGFGYSDFGNAEPSLQMQAEALAIIVKDLSNRKKILVGHSMGGPVIARFAMDYPNLTDGLLMIAPSISPELEPSNAWRKFLNLPPIRWLTPAALRVCNQEIIPLKEELNAMMSRWKNIRAPLTVVQGEADDLVPMGNAFFAEKMMAAGQVKLNMIKGGNHFILWSELELVKKELLELINK